MTAPVTFHVCNNWRCMLSLLCTCSNVLLFSALPLHMRLVKLARVGRFYAGYRPAVLTPSTGDLQL